MKRHVLTAAATLMLTGAAMAQEPIKIGFLSTFSGPSAQLGQELLDGFKLGLEQNGNKLGGRPVELIQADDQAKPDVARQHTDKMLERDKIHILTGINFSNVMLAVAKPALDAGTFVYSINAGPSQYAGSQCHPYYFNVSFQNDTAPEAMGLYLQNKGIKRMYLMAPNYPAGKDFLAGFKRFYKGEIVGEVYTTFGQLDYAADIAQLRAANPQGVFFFYPGGMGINFVKQYNQAGLSKTVPLYGPSFSLDQTVLPAIGDAALGSFASAFWTETTDNPQSKKFVADFEAKYGRLPSPNAANAFDGVRLLDAALTSIGGKIEDKAAFRKALENVKFTSLRGNFKFNKNHYPVQDFYLTEITKDAKGRPIMTVREKIDSNHEDAYVKDCKMAAN
ncbi:MAG: ABC transporter substrate-binding protein [Xanthobacteraceae bacterium]|nr:MAG: ABC transporter substrate-binding protein [Xanthobacteraceae bacterium]